MNSQRGITLVELLAAITIVSIVGLLVWGVLIQGTKYSEQAVTKNQLTQEANIVISTARSIHQNSDEYTITSNTDCGIRIGEKDFNHPNICYKVSNLKDSDENTINNGEDIDPRDEKYHSISFGLTVEDRENAENAVEIRTELYRLSEE